MFKIVNDIFEKIKTNYIDIPKNYSIDIFSYYYYYFRLYTIHTKIKNY